MKQIVVVDASRAGLLHTCNGRPILWGKKVHVLPAMNTCRKKNQWKNNRWGRTLGAVSNGDMAGSFQNHNTQKHSLTSPLCQVMSPQKWEVWKTMPELFNFFRLPLLHK